MRTDRQTDMTKLHTHESKLSYTLKNTAAFLRRVLQKWTDPLDPDLPKSKNVCELWIYIHLLFYVKYDFHFTDCYETRSFKMILREGICYRILSKSEEKCRNYGQSVI
jgi:hypothetical protein